jgi:DNA-binding MarR family transcriptional regulator
MGKPFSIEAGDLLPQDRNGLFEAYGLRILRALRSIMHAWDSHSRRLNSELSITGPQMLCLYALVHDGVETQSELVKQVELGASTVNGIVDRLESKGLVSRERSVRDRRRVLLRVSDSGKQVALGASSLMQPQLAHALQSLPELEQAAIALSLERIVELMRAHLANGGDPSPEQVQDGLAESRANVA